MVRPPLEFVWKHKTPQELHQYFLWMKFADGHYDKYGYRHPEKYFGVRTRWFHSFMDMCPRFIWRWFPLKVQAAYMFGDVTEQ